MDGVEVTGVGAIKRKRVVVKTLNDFQSAASRTIDPKLAKHQVEKHALFCLASETGELLGIYQKQYQGHRFDEHHAMLEAGDVLWALSEYCTSMGWTLEEVAQVNVDKLSARYPAGFDPGRSLHRRDGDI